MLLSSSGHYVYVLLLFIVTTVSSCKVVDQFGAHISIIWVEDAPKSTDPNVIND